jgi:nucleotide-binding universal stress UspA family protein
MKNILALTDFSPNSINAIDYALHLFEGDLKTLYILHSKSPESAYTTAEIVAAGSDSLYNSLVIDAKQQLDQLIKDLKNKFDTKSITFRPIIDYDILTDAVNQVVDSKKIDFVVMGTNGVTDAKEVVFGSNTINVIRNVHHPILTIPHEYKFKPIQDILLPLHEYDNLGSKSFHDVVGFAKQFGTHIHALRINPTGESTSEEVQDNKELTSLFKNLNCEFHVVNDVPLNYVVDCFLQTHHIDLVILMVKPEGFFERFFKGSSTTKIANDLRAPLLVIPN